MILYSWKSLPRENFCLYRLLLSWAKFLFSEFFCPMSMIINIIEPMAIFTTWVKIYLTKHLCNERVAGLGEIFV